MSLKGSVKKQSGTGGLFLIVMIVALLIFAYYVILRCHPQEILNIPQMMVTNNAGRMVPDSLKKMKTDKSAPRADLSVRGQAEQMVKGLDTQEITGTAEKMGKSVRKTKRISRTFEALKQSNLVIEKILLEKR